MKGSIVILTVVMLAACGKKEAEQRAAAAEAKLAQMNTIAAEKDSLMNEMVATTSFITQMDSELSKLKSTKKNGTVSYQETVIPVSEYRSKMLSRIHELGDRLDETEQKLKASQARLRKALAADQDMTARIAVFEQQIADFQALIEEQRSQIGRLTVQVDTLRAANTRLAAERDTLTTQVADLTTLANTVYYVIGNKNELLAKGVVQEEGGARVLGVFGKSGKTLVPGRGLSETEFIAIDKRSTFDIELPRQDKAYKIITPHSTVQIEPQPDKNGKVRGKIHIGNPDAFWAQSKYLIIVES
jgi:hypothetical protein